MLGQGLSSKEIADRLVRLRNLEYLHKKQKIRLTKVLDENKGLRARVLELETIVSSQQKTIEDLKLQMEELRSIIFGKKRKKGEDNDDPEDDLTPPKKQTERTPDSYKRPIPQDEEVTETKDHPLNECNKCHSKTTKKKTVVYYEEDIPIPTKKIVRKHIVEKSYCPLCRKWNTSVPLPAQRVILGDNVQRYICYLSVVCRLSFSQIQNILSDTFNLGISQGEIAKILNREATRLRPFYEQLKVRIRGEPSVHLDETGWNLFIGDGYQRYAWTMSGGESGESIYILGKIPVFVIQIADSIVNRVVCWKKAGAAVSRGERIGMIRMGSQVDVILPLKLGRKNIKILAKEGQYVHAGETGLASF